MGLSEKDRIRLANFKEPEIALGAQPLQTHKSLVNSMSQPRLGNVARGSPTVSDRLLREENHAHRLSHHGRA